MQRDPNVLAGTLVGLPSVMFSDNDEEDFHSQDSEARGSYRFY